MSDPLIITCKFRFSLQKDVHLPLLTTCHDLDLASHFSKLDSRLTQENLDKLRSYISACRLINYSVSDETQKVSSLRKVILTSLM